jgi:hypothetical protein
MSNEFNLERAENGEPIEANFGTNDKPVWVPCKYRFWDDHDGMFVTVYIPSWGRLWGDYSWYFRMADLE